MIIWKAERHDRVEPEGTVCFVTGAALCIGEGIARRDIEDGTRLVIAARA